MQESKMQRYCIGWEPEREGEGVKKCNRSGDNSNDSCN